MIQLKKILKDFIIIVMSSFISSFALYYFVFPADFAPTGIDGIATMMQELLKINAGYFSLILNAPLLIASFFILSKKYAIYTVIYTLVSSGLLVLFADIIKLPQYNADNNVILAAIFSGVLLGARTGFMVKIGASSGGVDVVASMIQKNNPYVNIERYITVLCCIIIGSSFFVYQQVDSILLSVIQIVVFEKSMEIVMKNIRNAVEFKIITDKPDLLKDEIIQNLKHGATIVESKGMFTGNQKTIIFCVVNTRQVPEFMNLLKKYDNLFVYCSDVSSVNGNFRWHKEDVAK